MWKWRLLLRLIRWTSLTEAARTRRLSRLRDAAIRESNEVLGTWSTILSRTKSDFRPVMHLEGHERVAVVVQGPLLHADRFTADTLRLYRTTFPGAELILSTWDTEDAAVLRDIEALGVTIVTDSPPARRGPQNVNCQLRSSLNGVRKARDLGAEFVLKTRTDQRFYALNVGDFLAGLVRTFEVPLHVGARGRIAVLDLVTRTCVPHHASDFMSFGFTEDMLRLWSAPPCKKEFELPKGGFRGNTIEEFFGRIPVPETYVCEQYLKSLGRDATPSIQNWKRTLAEVYIVVDRASLGFFWPKYSYMIEHADWQAAGTPLGMCSFADWVALAVQGKSIPEDLEKILQGPPDDELRGAQPALMLPPKGARSMAGAESGFAGS